MLAVHVIYPVAILEQLVARALLPTLRLLMLDMPERGAVERLHARAHTHLARLHLVADQLHQPVQYLRRHRLHHIPQEMVGHNRTSPQNSRHTRECVYVYPHASEALLVSRGMQAGCKAQGLTPVLCPVELSQQLRVLRLEHVAYA